ncbi:hypothetical protein BT69DRAFT_113700 [Atractiella rhizophila]|nr:hypothetical protein BT69DRAFT_113700 [Atractiella rhizophila]
MNLESPQLTELFCPQNRAAFKLTLPSVNLSSRHRTALNNCFMLGSRCGQFILEVVICWVIVDMNMWPEGRDVESDIHGDGPHI